MDHSEVERSWYQGAWVQLSQIELSEIEDSRDRTTIALVVAIAHLQRNNKEAAGIFVNAALGWGCSPRVASGILVKGLHNSLARASALAGLECSKFNYHFSKSVSLESNEARKPAVDIRAVAELVDLGLLEEATRLIEEREGVLESLNGVNNVKLDFLAAQRNILRIKRALLSRNSKEVGKHSGNYVSIPKANEQGLRLVILVAGMRHSGSTALFNILRLGMETLGVSFESGYTEKYDLERVKQSDSGIFLLKTHEYRDDVAQVADFTFTSKRDLRDTVASAVRRHFPLCERLNPIEYSKYNRQLWEVWSTRSDYEFHYEEHMRSPVESIINVLASVGLQDVEAHDIARKINALPTDQYSVTLLSPTHITDPERKLTYEDTLTQEQVGVINRNNNRWLEVQGYE